MDKQLSEQSKHLGLVRDTQALRATIASLIKVTRSKKEKALLQLLEEKFVEIPVSEINLAEISDNILSLLDIFQSDFVIVDSIDAINKKLNLSFNKARAAANHVAGTPGHLHAGTGSISDHPGQQNRRRWPA